MGNADSRAVFLRGPDLGIGISKPPQVQGLQGPHFEEHYLQACPFLHPDEEAPGCVTLAAPEGHTPVLGIRPLRTCLRHLLILPESHTLTPPDGTTIAPIIQDGKTEMDEVPKATQLVDRPRLCQGPSGPPLPKGSHRADQDSGCSEAGLVLSPTATLQASGSARWHSRHPPASKHWSRSLVGVSQGKGPVPNYQPSVFPSPAPRRPPELPSVSLFSQPPWSLPVPRKLPCHPPAPVLKNPVLCLRNKDLNSPGRAWAPRHTARFKAQHRCIQAVWP